MPTLHRLKLLASHCAPTPTTTASPTASPVISRRRRRQSLRMLLHRQDPPETADKEVGVRVRRKLKDLLLSSSPPPAIGDQKIRRRSQRQEQEGLIPAAHASSSFSFRFRNGSILQRGSSAVILPVSLAFRRRVSRRAWRPVLLSIPE